MTTMLTSGTQADKKELASVYDLPNCTCFDYFQDEFFLPLGMLCIG